MRSRLGATLVIAAVAAVVVVDWNSTVAKRPTFCLSGSKCTSCFVSGPDMEACPLHPSKVCSHHSSSLSQCATTAVECAVVVGGQ